MTESINFGEPGSELMWGGDADGDGRGIGSDAEDIATDFGKDMAWNGESIGSVAWNDTGDILEGAVHGVEDLFGSTVTNDVKDAASDVGSFLDTAQQDIAQGAGDAVTDVGDGAEDVVDGIEDAADDIGDLF